MIINNDSTAKSPRIGILTFQRIENYGAALQCFALWYFLNEHGYNTEIIDLLTPEHSQYVKSNNAIRVHKHRHPIWSLARSCYRSVLSNWHILCHHHDLAVRRKRFEDFFSLSSYSRRYSGFDEIVDDPPIYDIYITGSDQTWNPNICFDWEAYFLTFAPKGAKKIAYAPSIALSDIPSNFQKYMQLWLKDYSALSCRELSGVEIIKRLTGINAEHVADPTFLLTQEQWTDLANIPDKKAGPYILCLWFCGGAELKNKIAFSKDLKNITGKRVVILPTPGCSFPSPPELEVIFDAGPKEFIGLIINADMVLTNSFHGTVFAAFFATSFYVFLRNDAIDDRMISLMHLLEIENRIVDSLTSDKADEIAQCLPIDRNTLNDNLAKFRNKSIQFLLHALELETH